MGRIWSDAIELATTRVVEAEHELGVAHPRLRRGHFHHVVILPEAIAIAERPDAALLRDSGTREHHQHRLSFCCRHVLKMD